MRQCRQCRQQSVRFAVDKWNGREWQDINEFSWLAFTDEDLQDVDAHA
jgi:hypothetical protein